MDLKNMNMSDLKGKLGSVDKKNINQIWDWIRRYNFIFNYLLRNSKSNGQRKKSKV